MKRSLLVSLASIVLVAACDDGPDAPAPSSANVQAGSGTSATAGAGGADGGRAGNGGGAGNDITEPAPALAVVGEPCFAKGRGCVPTAYCAYEQDCTGEGRCFEKPQGCVTACDPDRPEGFCGCDGHVYCARCDLAFQGISEASDPSFCAPK